MAEFPPSNHKILLTIGVLLLLAGLIVFFGIVPLIGAVRTSKASIAQNRAELADLNAKINAFQQTEAKLATVQDEVYDVSELFPVREDSVVIIEALESAVSRAGLDASLSITDTQDQIQISSSSTPPPVVKNLSGIDQVPYALHFSADYTQLINLFLNLENLPFPTEITDLNTSAQTASTQNGRALRQTGTAAVEIRGLMFIRKP